jgi:hypothetical protein
MSSWHGAPLKKAQGHLYLYFTYLTNDDVEIKLYKTSTGFR